MSRDGWLPPGVTDAERYKDALLEVYRQLLHGGTRAHMRNALQIIRAVLHQDDQAAPKTLIANADRQRRRRRI